MEGGRGEWITQVMIWGVRDTDDNLQTMQVIIVDLTKEHYSKWIRLVTWNELLDKGSKLE